MSNEVQVFDNLKVKEVNGQVMFDAETAAIGLGLTQTKNGKIYVRWETVTKYLSQKVGKSDFITEPQFYKLAIKANNETAERFQAWVTEEVLPSIRKTGSYGVRELTQEEIVGKAFMIEHNRAEQLQLENEVLKPKAELHDKFIATGGAIGIREAAKEMQVKQTDLVDNLLNSKYIYRTQGHHGKLQPYTQYVPKYFVLKSGGTNSEGIEFLPSLRITPTGRELFYKKFFAPNQTELEV
ncbi:phage antirepressor KilAC domain-containing protein [uncultured Weissella sp.]|uniref:phage antirepressor KilAC domain-containing protein n=1 Tax=uncultured Weissella sp. TaxID=253243 RepID=UPI002584F43B|nr:phage antirepressor KilAC domain-containing protein [uncultured Weissella sp.]